MVRWTAAICGEAKIMPPALPLAGLAQLLVFLFQLADAPRPLDDDACSTSMSIGLAMKSKAPLPMAADRIGAVRIAADDDHLGDAG